MSVNTSAMSCRWKGKQNTFQGKMRHSTSPKVVTKKGKRMVNSLVGQWKEMDTTQIAQRKHPGEFTEEAGSLKPGLNLLNYRNLNHTAIKSHVFGWLHGLSLSSKSCMVSCMNKEFRRRLEKYYQLEGIIWRESTLAKVAMWCASMKYRWLFCEF